MGGEILIFLLPVVLLFLLFNGQRKRQRQQANLQSQVEPGTRICTTSGLFGTVVEISDTDFVIEAAPGVHLRFDRRAIGLVVPSEVPGDDDDPTEAPTEHPTEPDAAGESDGHGRPA